jgi:hypothetical protein
MSYQTSTNRLTIQSPDGSKNVTLLKRYEFGCLLTYKMSKNSMITKGWCANAVAISTGKDATQSVEIEGVGAQRSMKSSSDFSVHCSNRVMCDVLIIDKYDSINLDFNQGRDLLFTYFRAVIPGSLRKI